MFHFHFPSEGPSYFIISYHLGFFFCSHSPLFSRFQVFTVVHFVYINTNSASWILRWKFDFLLFPGWTSALSLATSAVLVASVTAVDISVLLLFSLSVLRVCSTFFGWWWNQRFHCSTVSSAWERRISWICPGTVEKDIWKSHLNGQKKSKDENRGALFFSQGFN